ncbi:MAG TPA: HAMP domain-containing sensor histidine kinase [Phycisphaerae bacterium]|nr:HAMP domain-containing sensor histidine kinase [Phycisphaerae bacterium]
MTLPKTTRRRAVFALALIWILVIGGLAWATSAAIRLERLEARYERDEAETVRLERAVRLMEAVVAPVLDQESTRPYEHFRAFYVPARARDKMDGSDVSERILVPSPLQNFKGPDWLLLHFQGSDTEGWVSPQLEAGAGSAMPAGAFPAAERARQASAANWLAALRDRYSPVTMLSILEEALSKEINGRSSLLGESSTWQGGRAESSPARSTFSSDTSGPPDKEPGRGAADFYRRSARLLQMQREYFPLYQCEPETVALENLDAERREPQNNGTSGACVQVSRTLMMPIWLDLTFDGRQQLALVRSVSVETQPYCTLQGVLIDWDRLRAVLEGEIRDIFPNARVVPLASSEYSERRPPHGTMQRIPVRLEPNEAAGVRTRENEKSSWGGLAIAWAATLLALTAISYGTLKYISYSERRMQFVAAVTHELRTPLTSFQLYSDLLGEMKTEDGEKRRQYARTLGTESKRLARLVENVLAYSRVGDQSPRLSPQAVSPQSLLDSAVSLTAETCAAAAKQIVVENRCPREMMLHTDPQLVVQILANLLENACKYSGDAADPRVWLSVSPAGDGAIFEVDDAGPGVPSRMRRAVFEPFRRGSSEPQRKSSGVGLGLSLSRYWAECLGGHLSLKKSTRNGTHYSCFALTLPSRLPANREIVGS